MYGHLNLILWTLETWHLYYYYKPYTDVHNLMSTNGYNYTLDNNYIQHYWDYFSLHTHPNFRFRFRFRFWPRAAMSLRRHVAAVTICHRRSRWQGWPERHGCSEIGPRVGSKGDPSPMPTPPPPHTHTHTHTRGTLSRPSAANVAWHHRRVDTLIKIY